MENRFLSVGYFEIVIANLFLDLFNVLHAHLTVGEHVDSVYDDGVRACILFPPSCWRCLLGKVALE